MVIKLINLFFILIIPFLMVGIINKTKAFFSGKKGASIIQPFYDFIKLIKKESVYSNSTTFVFKIAPIVSFSSIVFASLFVPLAFNKPFIDIPFSFIIFSYTLGLGKFFSLIASLDTGSSFEGMGASREACFSTIVEPAFFIMMGSIAALSGANNFQGLSLIMNRAEGWGILIVFLCILTLFIMLLIEGCRVPVDDPDTHLELTMIHEVMVLDNSGIDLALITYGSAIKIFLIASLISSLIIPFDFPYWAEALGYLLTLFSISVIVGVVESSMARFRMSHVLEFIFVMSILAFLILILVTYGLYGGEM